MELEMMVHTNQLSSCRTRYDPFRLTSGPSPPIPICVVALGLEGNKEILGQVITENIDRHS